MIDLELLEELFKKTEGRVRYLLGSKAPRLSCDSSEIRTIDCSGYFRWLVYRASRGTVMAPDGSQIQKRWCADMGFRQLERYSDVQHAAEDPSRIFACFLSPKPGKEWPRHVWIVQAGMTMESCGSRGVCERVWFTKALNLDSAVAYEITNNG